MFESNLTEEQRFKLINKKKIPLCVIKYLDRTLSDLYITLKNNSGYVADLMKHGKLGGWCWQTTESSIVFFNDDDYIERGYLVFDKKREKYYHSWICFNFDDIEYVFDPSLNILCKKIDYTKVFEVEVLSQINAKLVKKELIDNIKNSNEEFIVRCSENINSPLYRNNSGYRGKIIDNKIKKLCVYYY